MTVDIFKPKGFKYFVRSNPFTPKWDRQCLVKTDGSRFVLAGPYIYEVLFINEAFLSRTFLSIVKCSSIHNMKLGFMDIFIYPMGLRCIITSKVIQLRKLVHDVLR